jgi:hypothetical protein
MDYKDDLFIRTPSRVLKCAAPAMLDEGVGRESGSPVWTSTDDGALRTSTPEVFRRACLLSRGSWSLLTPGSPANHFKE